MSEQALVKPSNGNGNGHGNGNGRPLPVVEAAALPAVDVPAYRPTVRDWLYLAAVEEIIAKDGRISEVAIAALLPGRMVKDLETGDVHEQKLTRQAIWRMRQRPGFEDWLGQQLRSQTDREWPTVLRRALRMAQRGSIDHMTFLAKVRGEFAEPASGPVSVQTALIIEVRYPGAERAPDGSHIPTSALRVLEG